MSEQPHFLKDLEIREIQSLDHAKLAESVLSGIRLASTPFRIALFGPWGSGKTTILKMVSEALGHSAEAEEGPYYRSVWFNAWDHESSANLFLSLVQTLVEQIPDAARYSRAGSAVVQRVIEAARLHGRRWSNGNGGFGHAAATSSADSVPPGATVATVRADLERFAELLLAAAGERRPRRLVVFVDDLDKCLPVHTLALLESLKLFFGGLAPVVVICSLDAQVLERVVRSKYEHDDAAFAESYIEKIFEFWYHVPAVDAVLMGSLVAEVYRRSGLGQRGVSEEQCELERGVIESLLGRTCLTLNPRAIKRIFNRFIWFLCREPSLDDDAALDAQVLEPWLAWLLVTDYWRGIGGLVERFGDVAFKELGNRLTGHPLFPHSNEACKQALDALPDARGLVEFLRASLPASADPHLPESQESLRGAVMRFASVDRVLRSYGM